NALGDPVEVLTANVTSGHLRSNSIIWTGAAARRDSVARATIRMEYQTCAGETGELLGERFAVRLPPRQKTAPPPPERGRPPRGLPLGRGAGGSPPRCGPRRENSRRPPGQSGGAALGVRFDRAGLGAAAAFAPELLAERVELADALEGAGQRFAAEVEGPRSAALGAEPLQLAAGFP